MKIYLVTGIPGSGKSTWIKKEAQRDNEIDFNVIVLSRDEIRFSLLNDNDDYFAHEDKVKKIFKHKFKDAIQNKQNDIIYLDATFLTKGARAWVVSMVNEERNKMENIQLFAYNFIIDINTCIERNELRHGRKKVPVEVIKKMYSYYQPVKVGEVGFDGSVTIYG